MNQLSKISNYYKYIKRITLTERINFRCNIKQCIYFLKLRAKLFFNSCH